MKRQATQWVIVRNDSSRTGTTTQGKPSVSPAHSRSIRRLPSIRKQHLPQLPSAPLVQPRNRDQTGAERTVITHDLIEGGIQKFCTDITQDSGGIRHPSRYVVMKSPPQHGCHVPRPGEFPRAPQVVPANCRYWHIQQDCTDESGAILAGLVMNESAGSKTTLCPAPMSTTYRNEPYPPTS